MVPRRPGKRAIVSSTITTILSPHHSADPIGRSHLTLRRIIPHGQLKAYRVPGTRLLRIKQADLEKAFKPVSPVAANLGGDAA